MFDEYFKELISGKNEEHPFPAVVGKIDNLLPMDHTVYDFMFEVSKKYCFVKSRNIHYVKTPHNTNIYSLIV